MTSKKKIKLKIGNTCIKIISMYIYIKKNIIVFLPQNFRTPHIISREIKVSHNKPVKVNHSGG